MLAFTRDSREGRAGQKPATHLQPGLTGSIAGRVQLRRRARRRKVIPDEWHSVAESGTTRRSVLAVRPAQLQTHRLPHRVAQYCGVMHSDAI